MSRIFATICLTALLAGCGSVGAGLGISPRLGSGKVDRRAAAALIPDV